MAQTYTFPIPAGRSAAELLEKAKAAGKSKRIAFSGDEKGGRFQGVAEGTYAEVSADPQVMEAYMGTAHG